MSDERSEDGRIIPCGCCEQTNRLVIKADWGGYFCQSCYKNQAWHQGRVTELRAQLAAANAEAERQRQKIVNLIAGGAWKTGPHQFDDLSAYLDTKDATIAAQAAEIERLKEAARAVVDTHSTRHEQRHMDKEIDARIHPQRLAFAIQKLGDTLITSESERSG